MLPSPRPARLSSGVSSLGSDFNADHGSMVPNGSISAQRSRSSRNITVTWAAVNDELRGKQSLSSILNNPRGKGLLRDRWEGVSDVIEAFGEIVEEIGDFCEEESQEGEATAVQAKTDALLGDVPRYADFAPYLETFQELWDIYYRSMSRGKQQIEGCRGGATGSTPATSLHHAVPHEYFSSDFKLERHQIFKQSLQTSVEFQEDLNIELTGYLDLVEVSLYEQIRQAQRDQVFESLAKLNKPLQEDLKSALTVFAQLRSRLHSVKQKQLRNGLAVGRLARRKRRTDEVLQRLDTLTNAHQSLPSIKMLLQAHDYVTALELLESTLSAADSHLKGVASGRASCARLNHLASTFDQNVETDFVQVSVETILGGCNARAVSSTESLPLVVPLVELQGSVDLPNIGRFKGLCWCLNKRDLMRPALNATLRDVLLSQLKKTLKSRARTLLEELGHLAGTFAAENGSLDHGAFADAEAAAAASAEAAIGRDDTPLGSPIPASSPIPPGTSPAGLTPDGGSQGISAQLCNLSFHYFLLFWRRILQDCLEVAARFCEFAFVIQTSLLEQDLSASGIEPDLHRLFEVVMNSYLQKAGVLLQTRQAEHRAMRSTEWKKLLRLSYDALDKIRGQVEQCKNRLNPGEQVSAGVDVRSSVRSILYTQTKYIIDEFDRLCVERLELALEQERWERTDIPSQYRGVMDQLMGIDIRRPAEDPTDPPTERYLAVEGAHFFVVPAVLTLLQLINDYVQMVREFDAMPEVIVQRLVNLLRCFKGNIHQLVLGGKAVQNQTLRRITASNLALSSQCCGLVSHLLPGLQLRLEGFINNSPSLSTAAQGAVTVLLGELTSVAEDYATHRRELFDKLAQMLIDRYVHHSGQWLHDPHNQIEPGSDAVFSADQGEIDTNQRFNLNPHPALEGFVKDITNLYKVLLRSLTGETVRQIFANAFEDIGGKFETRISEEFEAPTPPYEARIGRTLADRLVLDVAYLQDQLERYAGIATPLKMLLSNLCDHLRIRFESSDDPLRILHPHVVEVLQQVRRLLH